MQLLAEAVCRQASDILIIAGLPVSFKISSEIEQQGQVKLTPAMTEALIAEIYGLAQNRPMDNLLRRGDDDFSFSLPALSRFRVSAFRQRGSLAAVVRVITFSLPERSVLHIPDEVIAFSERRRGLVLVTGPAASGKSTTLACIIDEINRTRAAHIITIEDPIEFLHRHNKSVVTQREISTDTESYNGALRAALRQSPDVILLGEMRDHETIRTAITSAETGHLVISTLHTAGAAKTIDRILDAFPPEQQNQVRMQLAGILQGIVCQQLIPAVDGARVPAFEILVANNAVRALIRESKLHQLESAMQTAGKEGTVTMDNYLAGLVERGLVEGEVALRYAYSPERLAKKLGLAFEGVST
ncbi:MAG: PilT/PilU family type 4a pilus ATPase [Clostridiales bacterium]|nr:PilT/PilU family type 4a pilus ATPase [Clostridiales bacterium]